MMAVKAKRKGSLPRALFLANAARDVAVKSGDRATAILAGTLAMVMRVEMRGRRSPS